MGAAVAVGMGFAGGLKRFPSSKGGLGLGFPAGDAMGGGSGELRGGSGVDLEKEEREVRVWRVEVDVLHLISHVSPSRFHFIAFDLQSTHATLEKVYFSPEYI
jgi:hypothetical protein